MKLLQRRLLLLDVVGMQTIQVKSDLYYTTSAIDRHHRSSVQINVACLKTEDESKINPFYKQKFQDVKSKPLKQ